MLVDVAFHAHGVLHPFDVALFVQGEDAAADLAVFQDGRLDADVVRLVEPDDGFFTRDLEFFPEGFREGS